MSAMFIAPGGGLLWGVLRSQHLRRGLAGAAVGIAMAVIEAAWPTTS